jgi:urease gamma subunit
MFINDSVSFLDDKTDDFQVFTIEAVFPDGVKLHGIDRIIPRDELIIVH